MSIRCHLGFHEWHKDVYIGKFHGAQLYGRKVCERCGIRGHGFANRNHPDFRKLLGKYSEI